jgi:hypothetical protein
MRPRLLPSRTFWRPNEGCGGSRGTWKLVSAPCCESRTNWRARKCGRSSLGRCSRYWPEERSDESLRRHGIIVAAARVLKITTFSLSLLVSAAVSVHAQAQQPPRPASREAARPGTTQDFLGCLRQFAPTPRRQSRAVSLPPLPRPRPVELTSSPMEPKPEELAPASVQSGQPHTPTGPAPAPDESNEGPLND